MEIKYVDEVYIRIKDIDDPFQRLMKFTELLAPELRQQVADVKSLVELLDKEQCCIPMTHVFMTLKIDESIAAIAKLAKSNEVRILHGQSGTVMYCDLFSIFRALNHSFEKTLAYISENRMPDIIKPTTLYLALSATDIQDIQGFMNLDPMKGHIIYTAQREPDYGKQLESIELVRPYWWKSRLSNKPIEGQLAVEHEIFINSCQHSVDTYEQLTNLGLTSVQASAVLPRAQKKALLVTADDDSWNYIFKFINSRESF